MNQSYSIKDIIRLLLSHIWLIIVITVFGAGAAFVFPSSYCRCNIHRISPCMCRAIPASQRMQTV